MDTVEVGGVTAASTCRSDDPRVERTRTVVLAATRALLSEVGVERTTIENVAERSGVARSTIYRHWPGKPQLVMDALADVRDVQCCATCNDPLEALRSQLHELGEMLRTPFSSVLGDLMATADRDFELAAIHQSFVAARRRGMVEWVTALRSMGRIRDEVSSDWLVDLVVAPLMYRRFSVREPLSPDGIDRHLDGVLALVAPGPTRPQSAPTTISEE